MIALLFCAFVQDGRALSIDETPQASYYRAVLIGINDYSHHKKLKTPVNDVQELALVLRSRYGFETEVLVDGAATEEGIRTAFEQMMRTSGPGDSVLFYFAGHGIEGTGQSGYWVPQDARGKQSDLIANSVIIDFAENCPARHVLIISDACFSGSIFKGSGDMESALEVAEAYQRPSRMVISSGNLTTVDDVGLGDKHSPFAHHLIEILEKNTQPYTTPQELKWKLGRDVARDSKRHQVPMVGALHEAGHEGGSFIFWNKNLPDSNGKPYPPPWEASVSDLLPIQLKPLQGRRILVQNQADESLCKILSETLGMVVDCDMDTRSRMRRSIVAWCPDIDHQSIVALRDFLKLDRYTLKTHQTNPEGAAYEECGTDFEITIRN